MIFTKIIRGFIRPKHFFVSYHEILNVRFCTP